MADMGLEKPLVSTARHGAPGFVMRTKGRFGVPYVKASRLMGIGEGLRMNVRGLGLAGVVFGLTLGFGVGSLRAETCVTQAQMTAADRDGLAAAAAGLARQIQANDQAAVKAVTIAEFQKDFGALGELIGTTAAKVKGGAPEVETVYVLDASGLKPAVGAAGADAAFNCPLKNGTGEVDFNIPQLPAGRYGFAMVKVNGAAVPYRLSLLLRQEQVAWHLAGLYPKALTAGGHDGLWYWTEARAMKSRNEGWNAWLYLQEAQALLQPVGFVSSTHLDKLGTETGAATPPALSSGLSADVPLVVKGADGVEYAFTAMTVDDSLGKEKVDVAAHLKVASLGDAAAARKRNVDAMTALVAAHPELRKAFHGMWIFADAPGLSAYATEQAMGEIR